MRYTTSAMTAALRLALVLLILCVGKASADVTLNFHPATSEWDLAWIRGNLTVPTNFTGTIILRSKREHNNTHIGTATVQYTNGVRANNATGAITLGNSGQRSSTTGDFTTVLFTWEIQNDGIGERAIAPKKIITGVLNAPGSMQHKDLDFFIETAPAPRNIVFLLDTTINKGAGSTNVAGTFWLTLHVDGAQKFEQQVTVESTDFARVIVKTPAIQVPGAFSYVWKFNGSPTAAAGSRAAADEIPGNQISDVLNVSQAATGTPPEPGPGVQSTETNKVKAEPDAIQTTTTTQPEPVVYSDGFIGPIPPPVTRVSSNMTGGGTTTPNMTKQDFYAATRQAVVDALEQTKVAGAGEKSSANTEPTVPAGSFTGSVTAPTFDDIQEDAGLQAKEATATADVATIAESVADMRTKWDNLKGSADSAFNRATQITLPTVTSSTLSGIQISGVLGVTKVVDLAPYASVIGWVRQLQVLIITVILWRRSIQMVSGIWAFGDQRINT
jgi:hypothetical protein